MFRGTNGFVRTGVVAAFSEVLIELRGDSEGLIDWGFRGGKHTVNELAT